MPLEVEATLCCGECRAQLAFIFEQQILRVEDFLEEMRVGTVAGSDCFLLTIESPANFLASSVVVNFLEALAVLDVRELFALLILGKINDKLSHGIDAFFLSRKLFLQVSLYVAFNLLSLICHFNYFNYSLID